jgi:hypothetical protein
MPLDPSRYTVPLDPSRYTVPLGRYTVPLDRYTVPLDPRYTVPLGRRYTVPLGRYTVPLDRRYTVPPVLVTKIDPIICQPYVVATCTLRSVPPRAWGAGTARGGAAVGG